MEKGGRGRVHRINEISPKYRRDVLGFSVYILPGFTSFSLVVREVRIFAQKPRIGSNFGRGTRINSPVVERVEWAPDESLFSGTKVQRTFDEAATVIQSGNLTTCAR